MFSTFNVDNLIFCNNNNNNNNKNNKNKNNNINYRARCKATRSSVTKSAKFSNRKWRHHLNVRHFQQK